MPLRANAPGGAHHESIGSKSHQTVNHNAGSFPRHKAAPTLQNILAQKILAQKILASPQGSA